MFKILGSPGYKVGEVIAITLQGGVTKKVLVTEVTDDSFTVADIPKKVPPVQSIAPRKPKPIATPATLKMQSGSVTLHRGLWWCKFHVSKSQVTIHDMFGDQVLLTHIFTKDKARQYWKDKVAEGFRTVTI